MSIWIWIGVGLLALLIVVAIVSGVAGIITAFVVAMYHGFFKADKLPGENDSKWSPDQASEVEK